MSQKGYVMTYNNIIEFVTQNPVCTIATVEKNKPHNRAFLTNIIDDKIYFTTSSHKNVGKEILENHNIELCYLSANFSKMLRINTTVKIEENIVMKQKMIDEKDYLKNFKADDKTFILFTLSNAKATFWTIENNMNESDLESVEF